MGWSFRKSVGAGPFRINFSKSGISYSFGVKGASVNTGSRGTYVSFGSNGIYYRRKILTAPPRGRLNSSEELGTDENDQHTITSGPIEQLTDLDSQDFVNELNEKSRKISYLNWFGIPLMLAFIVAFFMYYQQVAEERVSYRRLVSVRPGHYGINIRSAADPASKIIGKADLYTEYIFLDSANGWYQVSYENAVHRDTAFISSQFTRIDSSLASRVSTTRMQKEGKQPVVNLGCGLAACMLFCFFLRRVDRRRLSMEIEYQLDDQVQEVYTQFLQFFAEGASSSRVWQIIHSQRTHDWKRNSGASNLVNRISVGGVYLDKRPAPFFRTNIQIPSLQLRGTSLYFFPERLLIRKDRQFAAVFYKNLNVEEYATRFIEDGSVPHDAVVVDRTWRFVNKNGGPDRRFNNNRQLPICHYSYFTFTSGSGVYETICTSKPGAFSRFGRFISLIGQFQTTEQTD